MQVFRKASTQSTKLEILNDKHTNELQLAQEYHYAHFTRVSTIMNYLEFEMSYDEIFVLKGILPVERIGKMT